MSELHKNKKRNIARSVAFTGIFSALSAVLMMLSFSVPFMPFFIKLDFSELPALLAAFSLGPIEGVLVCLVKNLVNLPMTTTGGVGELCNFLLGALFVLPAGILYRLKKNRKMALVGSLAGSIASALCSLPLNYFVTYPIYSKFMPIDEIVGLYQQIVPSVDGLFVCLLVFNVPFTLLKGLLNTLIAFLIYKHISPLIHGRNT